MIHGGFLRPKTRKDTYLEMFSYFCRPKCRPHLTERKSVCPGVWGEGGMNGLSKKLVSLYGKNPASFFFISGLVI